MKSEKFTVNTAKSVKKLLDGVLKVEANSASCLIIYEPKTPAELKNLKRLDEMQYISLWLLRKGVITKEDIELYNYAAMSLLMIFKLQRNKITKMEENNYEQI